MTDLKDQYTLKSDVYPSDITSAHNMLENYSSKSNPQKNNNDQQNTEGLQFAQRNGPVPGKDRKTFAHIECFKCNKKGHYANQCPNVNEEGIQLMIEGIEKEDEMKEDNLLAFSFLYQNKFNSIPDTCILIDTGSTISVFKNKHLLEDIGKNNNTLRAYTNGGYQDSSLQGHLPSF